MSDAPVKQPSYVIGTSDEEYTRLADIAEMNAVHVRDGCRRVGVPAGATAIEVGCGAPGALPALAAVVGPQGRVVGLDFDAETVAKAQEIVRRQHLSNVSVIQADVHTLDPERICPPGKFDLAYCRLFLVHQQDVPVTLRRMAALVRSGGHLLIQESLLDPRLAEPPFTEPAAPALRDAYRMIIDALRRNGGHPEIAQYLEEALREAGVEVLGQRLYSEAEGERSGPRGVVPFMHGVRILLQGMRQAIVARQVATDAEVDALVAGLTAARTVSYRTFFARLNVEAIARVP